MQYLNLGINQNKIYKIT